MATYMNDKEKKLADEVGRNTAMADAAVAELLEILRRQDQAALDIFVKERLYQAVDPVSDAIGKLVDLQIEVAQETYNASAASFATARVIMAGTIILGGLALAFALLTTLMSVVRPLSAITLVMQQLAKGDYSVTVPGLERKDEMGEMARAVQIFKNTGMEMEQRRADQERSREQAEAEKRVQ